MYHLLKMELKTGVRVVTIKDGKVLLINNRRDDFYYFIGGKIEAGETLEECVKRELEEESGMEIKVEFKKIIYISEFIVPGREKHQIDFYVWVEIDKYEELEGLVDKTHDGTDNLTWADLNKLPESLKPMKVAEYIRDNYSGGFTDANVKIITDRIDS